jgi:predicted neuraminidase
MLANSIGEFECAVYVCKHSATTVACVYLELLNEVSNNHNFLLRAITRDKIWGYCYYPETKQQSCHWKRLSSPKSEESEECHIEHQKHIGDSF